MRQRKQTTIVLIAASVALCGAAASPRGLQNFTFRWAVAGEPLTVPSDVKCDQSDKPSADTRCGEIANSIGSVQTFVTNYYLYQSRLTDMVVIFGRNDFDSVIEPLNAKYGKPCASSITKMQNGFGAVFANHHIVWCFKTGKLTLNERDMGGATLIYKDKWSMPSAKPTVNF